MAGLPADCNDLQYRRDERRMSKHSRAAQVSRNL